MLVRPLAITHANIPRKKILKSIEKKYYMKKNIRIN